MKQSAQITFFLMILFITPGCSRVIDWAKDEVPQIDCCADEQELSCMFVRTIQSYDQFHLRAKFDLLFLSDSVMEYYVKRYAYRHGILAQQQEVMLKNEMQEGKHFISFYVLSLYDVPLSKESEWTMLLEVDGTLYPILEIVQVELPREYYCLFGTKFNRFKTAYKVRFDAQDSVGNDIITGKEQTMRLLFRNVDCQVAACWKLQ